MYLTDRLPKANYNEEGNDASHLSLPHNKLPNPNSPYGAKPGIISPKP